MAVIVQMMADRAEARSKANGFVDVYKIRREEHSKAKKAARAFLKKLQTVIDGFQIDLERVDGLSNRPRNNGPRLQEQMLVAESTKFAVDSFLSMPTIFDYPDFMKPVLLIEKLAVAAWNDVWETGSCDEKDKVGLGLRPEDPLVAFIRSALESIGWAGADKPGYSLDTISDHLRGRQNRPRGPRKGQP